MATLKYILKSKKKDGTYLAYIRVVHQRKSSLISTGIFVSESEVTKGGKIRNKSVVAKLEDIVIEYRDRLMHHPVDSMTLPEVVEVLSRKDDVFRLDFIEYSRSRIAKMLPGTQRSYLCALKWLTEVTGQKLPIDLFTRQVVDIVDRNLRESGLLRAPSLYMQCLKNLFKMATDEFNGEHIDTWKIRHNPFRNYKMPRERFVESRALSLDQIRAILSLPYADFRTTKNPAMYNLAKDMFALSIALLGINSADLYTCADLRDGVITYNRQKTKGKRPDAALMRVNVPAEVTELVSKYKGSDRVFNFADRYNTSEIFNQAINKGLKELLPDVNRILEQRGSEPIGDSLTYYYARHSIATFAENELGIDKYTVARLLNHSLEGSLRTTDRYTKKDWTKIFEINSRITSALFGGPYDCNESEAVKLSGRSNTGYKGVYAYKGRFRAVVFADGTNRNVGFFATAEEAVRAREEYLNKT